MSEIRESEALVKKGTECTAETSRSPIDDLEARDLTQAEIRRNMILCIMMDAIFLTGWTDWGMAMIPCLTYLGASYFVIGIVNSAALVSLVGLFCSPWITRRFRIKKWYLIVVHIPNIAPIGIIGFCTVTSRHFGISNGALLGIAVCSVLASQFFGGFTSLPQQEYMAGTIPMSHRGRFSGLSQSVGSVASMGSAAIGGWILYHYSKPMSFGYMFLMTWSICQSGYFLAAFAKEKPVPVEKSPSPWSKDMLKAAWNDKPWLRVMLFTCITLISTAGFSFIVPYGYKQLHMPEWWAAILMMISKCVAIPASTVAGFIVDKLGPKRLYPYIPVLMGVQMLPVLFIHNAYGICGHMALNAALQALICVLNIKIWFSLPKPENRAGHYTLQLMMQSLVNGVALLMLGRVLDTVYPMTVFIVTTIVVFALYPIARWVSSALSDDPKAYS